MTVNKRLTPNEALTITSWLYDEAPAWIVARLRALSVPRPQQQPVVVQHGLWIEYVVGFLEIKAEQGDAGAAVLLMEYKRINATTDNRRSNA